MTVSANSVKEFTRREILRRALKKARLLTSAQNPSETSPIVQDASECLEMKLADLQAEGMLDETGELKTIALTAGTTPETAIALPDDTNDVRGVCMLIVNGAETQVSPMDVEEWKQLPDKTVLGTPTRFYIHRLLGVSLYLWPGVDSGAIGWSLRYRQIRLLKGDGDGTTTMDLRRHWTTYLVYAVAHELATDNSQDVQYCGYLRSERDRLLGKSLGHARPKGPIQMRSTLRGPWR